MDDTQKQLVKDITETLSKHGFDARDIADIIAFILTIRQLTQVRVEINDLYAPPDSDTESN